MLGSSSESEADVEPDDQAQDKRSSQPAQGTESSEHSKEFKLTWLRDIEPTLDVLDFVQGLLVEGGAAVVYGESNAGKTFWTVDLALHVATGLQYFGRRVEAGGVVYVSMEGSALFRNRLAAWRNERGLNEQDIPFAAIQSAANLLDPKADTQRLIETIKSAAKKIDVPVKMVVIDTLSRALAGGNENGPEDMGALVLNMDRIREETRASMLFVHHSGKDQAKGSRGHSLLRGAIDTEIEVVDNAGVKTATVGKQRDLKKGDVFQFSLKTLELGRNRYDEPVTTCLVEPEGITLKAKADKPTRLTNNEQIAFNMLRRVISNHGRPLPNVVGYPPDVSAVTEKEWHQAYNQGVPGDNADTKRRTYNRAKDSLLRKEVITSMDNWIWLSRRADE